MKVKYLMLALGVVTTVPANAHAAKTCVQVFEECLNESWDTEGLSRRLADLECAARYAGCIREAIF